MKKTFLSVLAVLFVSIALVSCGGSGPKDNAEKFLNAFYHMEYDKAGEYATADAKKQMDMLASFSGMMPDSSKKQLQKIKINVTDVKEEGDNATVTYTVTDPTNKAPEAGAQSLKMVKQNGKWLAAWSKQDMMGGAGGMDSGAGMEGGTGTDGSMTDPGMMGTDTSMMTAPMEGTTPAMGDTMAPMQ